MKSIPIPLLPQEGKKQIVNGNHIPYNVVNNSCQCDTKILGMISK